MKIKFVFMSFCCLILALNANAQLLDKLKERAKQKGLETRKVSYDSSQVNIDTIYVEEKEIKSTEDFFTMDVVMKLYDENGGWVQTANFDKEVIAMRTETKVSSKPVYHDKQGKFYAFNEEENQYESISLLPPSSMGFMMAGMIPQFYQLPQTPYLEAFEALSKLDVAISFYALELCFIYKPQHFEEDPDLYIKSSIPCGSGECTKFSYIDSDYKGSYILFDSRGKLREFYIKTSRQQTYGDDKNQTGKFVYSYKPVTVQLPDAVEQSLVPGPLGKIIPLEKGLEPWKHNKKDKKNKND